MYVLGKIKIMTTPAHLYLRNRDWGLNEEHDRRLVEFGKVFR